MIQQIVKDYEVVVNFEPSDQSPNGESLSPKRMVFNILPDNSKEISVLDIGFGSGNFGELIKSNPTTSHWAVDGVDGWVVNCHNRNLFGKKIYRNIWHGLAQSIPSEVLAGYNIICLLDVIEHLDCDSAKYLLRNILSGMGDDSFLFISTPLWFMPQEHIQAGDLEEHLIGVPASSMMALIPTMYSIGNCLVGGFVLSKKSLSFINFFQPVSDRQFTVEMGSMIMDSMNLPYSPGMVYKTSQMKY